MTALKSPQHALPPEKLKLLNDAVLERCDENDGVKERLLEDPSNCNFDPSALKCNGPETASCLTPQQLETVNAAYTDARKSTGELLYPRVSPSVANSAGASPNPAAWTSTCSATSRIRTPPGTGGPSTSKKDIERALLHGKEINAVKPDLAKFKARGGKLLIYHGWSDGGSGGAISALNTISYYESVLKHMGPNQDNWLRLFMIPGMAHCGGGTGPDQFNALATLERWLEQNEPPKSITAARVNERGRIDMTRPLCPYPQRAVYKGTGSTNDAANFTCKTKEY